jgi:hypothetical protein
MSVQSRQLRAAAEDPGRRLGRHLARHLVDHPASHFFVTLWLIDGVAGDDFVTLKRFHNQDRRLCDAGIKSRPVEG